MGKPTGFLDYERQDSGCTPPLERIKDFHEFHTPLPKEKQKLQGARCMACGVPFCQAGRIIAGMASGCPLNNLCPEWNDLVYLGNWKQAYMRLAKTNCFPEFTSRVCPALCEAACTCNLNGDPVATKENERAIIENAWESGLIRPEPPKVRTGKSVAVVGSGPSGLAAAQMLNKRGHSVTVFERRDRIGGLLRYGIPNMKLEKKVIDRRIRLMEEEGVSFVTNADVGTGVEAQKLLKEFDRVLLRPRGLVLQLLGQNIQPLRIGRFVQGLTVLSVAAVSLEITPAGLGMALAALVSGTLVFSGLMALQATASIWSVDSLELFNLATYGGVETAQYPLSLYDKWLRRFFTFVAPLGCVFYYPLLIILGKADPMGAAAWTGWASIWLGPVFFLISLAVFRVGVRHYRSTGS